MDDKEREEPVVFPVKCKTWKEVHDIQEKYLKPVRYGPKGQPIYNWNELAKLVIFPDAEQETR